MKYLRLNELKMGNIIRVREDFYIDSYNRYSVKGGNIKFYVGIELVVLGIGKNIQGPVIEYVPVCFVEDIDGKSEEELRREAIEKIMNHDLRSDEENENYLNYHNYLGVGTRSFKKLFEVVR